MSCHKWYMRFMIIEPEGGRPEGEPQVVYEVYNHWARGGQARRGRPEGDYKPDIAQVGMTPQTT